MSQSVKSLVSLVGRYEREAEFRDEDLDLHIISADTDENTLFVDFDSCPEWLPVKPEGNRFVIDEKYNIDPENMTYKLVE